jgi:hypothetical protein
LSIGTFDDDRSHMMLIILASVRQQEAGHANHTTAHYQHT